MSRGRRSWPVYSKCRNYHNVWYSNYDLLHERIWLRAWLFILHMATNNNKLSHYDYIMSRRRRFAETNIYIYIYIYMCIYIALYYITLSRRRRSWPRPAPRSPGTRTRRRALDLRGSTVDFHNFNLRIFNSRVSIPSKLIVDVF